MWEKILLLKLVGSKIAFQVKFAQDEYAELKRGKTIEAINLRKTNQARQIATEAVGVEFIVTMKYSFNLIRELFQELSYWFFMYEYVLWWNERNTLI